MDLKPFVYVRISEHPDIPLEEAMPLNQAVELFGKLDRQSVEEKDMAGYYKTHFEICFLSEGEVMSYTGRQDFGDGEGKFAGSCKSICRLLSPYRRRAAAYETDRQDNRRMGT